MQDTRFASMSETQIERLRQVEKSFNEEFNTKFYLIAMENEK